MNPNGQAPATATAALSSQPAPSSTQGNNDGWEPVPAQAISSTASPSNDGWEPVPQSSTSTSDDFDKEMMNLHLGELPGELINMGKGVLHGAADTLGGITGALSVSPTSIAGPAFAVISNYLKDHSENTGAPGSTAQAAQDIGYGGETLVEFLGGEGVLSSAAKLADTSKIMAVLEKSPKLLQAIKIGANALKSGTVQGAQTLARTGDLSEAVKSGAEMSATAGVLGGGGALVGKGVGAVAEKLGKVGKTAGELAETAANAPTEQNIAQNIQGRLSNAEDALHTNYENKTQEFQGRLEGAEVDAQEAPLANKAQDILAKPDPEEHTFVQQAAEARGQKLDKPVRELLENIAEGKKSLTDEDIEAADEANKTAQAEHQKAIKAAAKPKGLLGQMTETKAAVKPEPPEPIEPEAQAAEPYDARSIIKLRQEIRAMAAGYPPGDINARALKRLLWDASDHSSAFDDTFEQLAEQSDDPDVVKEYQDLRTDYRNKISKYDDPVIKNLMQGKVDDAARAYLGTKSASGLASSGKTRYNFENLKELLGPEAVQQFGNQVFKNLMSKAVDESTGFNAAQFVSNFGRINDATKEQLFGIKAAQDGQAWVQTELQSLAKDSKEVANIQKLTRLGLLGGATAAGVTHPGSAVGFGLATAIGLLNGAKNSGGGIVHARELIDNVANNPKVWALFRSAGKAAESGTVAKSAANIGSKAVTAAKAAVNQAQPSSEQKKQTISNALGGGSKKLTALTDGNTTPSAAASISNLPEQVQNAVDTIPVQITKGQPMTDPNGRANTTVTSNVEQGAGNNTIEVNNPKTFNNPVLGHELTHVWQNNLPPSVQSKIPDDPKDMSAFDISDADKLRKQGKTLVDLPREKQATIVQKYIEDPKKNANLKPWVDDMGNQALSSTMPTSPNATRLNMEPRAPGRASIGVAGAYPIAPRPKRK